MYAIVSPTSSKHSAASCIACASGQIERGGGRETYDALAITRQSLVPFSLALLLLFDLLLLQILGFVGAVFGVYGASSMC